MRLDQTTIHGLISNFLSTNAIDLKDLEFIDPWCLVFVCLSMVERAENRERKLILPTNTDVLSYLKRMHFEKLLNEFGYTESAQILSQIKLPEKDNLRVQELYHCNYRDEFNARLEYFIKMFQNFGLDEDDSRRATSLVGELGNNVFDHNSGNWPKNIVGCLIAGQCYPRRNEIMISVGDPGIGFLGSLKLAFPELEDDLSAIKKGLSGFTGRVGERRGNGLRLIQEWTINNFSGKVIIQSGSGQVEVSQKGLIEQSVPPILGTIASFVIYYK
ncbi:hypothetical protein A2876_00200 [Candidatus Amesbacteria bacterium RIFCSPHIGHO2_01_FULL_48_32b]|uniref:Histidine kinase/HSP90-like ATPase domain-containing protein n=1 Tax=Candidatus Amesbacteria bacterium RIFCSPHIGHO2_01_FULL_48_32b TaxID=1797253 RepID=A0A1F4YG94_9BACT|nr:MAG: hypothetical protein A2876_00200 [Candidatus Amesbacteria bacterium RIFCSPHIGHO2_01_FULL_48_32b]